MTTEQQNQTDETEEAPNANDEAGRVVLAMPEQKELAEESDIEFEDSPGVPGQIQYPEHSSMSQYAADDGEDDDGETEPEPLT
jgi:pyruvate/2-oxoglutarate dehydrogenase complex dihydrolipoamide acyltransferase (E2) component